MSSNLLWELTEIAILLQQLMVVIRCSIQIKSKLFLPNAQPKYTSVAVTIAIKTLAVLISQPARNPTISRILSQILHVFFESLVYYSCKSCSIVTSADKGNLFVESCLDQQSSIRVLLMIRKMLIDVCGLIIILMQGDIKT